MKDIPNRHILLVEDQIIIGMSQKMQLEQRGYKVTHVSTGEEALESINESDSRYDLILMDIDLGPGLDGIQTTEQIPEAYDIPVLFLSSHTDPDIVGKTEKVTSYGYVVKDSSITVLDASIKMAFKLFAAKQHEKKGRKQAESDAQISKENLEQLLERMLESFIVAEPILNEDGSIYDLRYLQVNKATEELTGITAENYIGRTVSEIFGDSRPELFINHTKVLKTGRPIKFTQEFSETGPWYDISIYKVDEEKLAIFFRDISERMLAQKALQESERKYRSLFDHMAQEVHFWKLVRDENGEIITWKLEDANPTALNGWKKTRDEVIGRKANDVFDGYDATGLFMPIVQQIFKDMKPHSWETKYDATGQHLFMTSVPFDEYFITTGIDITNKKLLEEQVLVKETLLKEVIHRIKNNFSSLQAILHLQASSTTHPEAVIVIKEFMGRIESLRQVYDKLLSVDQYQDINIKKYLEDLTASIIQLTPEEEGVKLHLALDDFVIKEKYVFPIGSIVNELITNSIKHAFEPNNTGAIKLSVEKVADTVILDYSDNGKGIPGKENDRTKGLGLMLIDLFTKQLKGQYMEVSGSGFHCRISFQARDLLGSVAE